MAMGPARTSDRGTPNVKVKTLMNAPLPPIMLKKLVRNTREASQFLKALANENRLMLLCILSEGEYSVTELETLLEIRQPTLSQQLAKLRANDLVTTRRDGKAIYYRLASEQAREIMELVYKHFCRG
jgi:DNA-binding transcriptional ArsR family regulator